MHLEGDVAVIDNSQDPPAAVICGYHVVRVVTWDAGDGVGMNIQSYLDEEDWLERGYGNPIGNGSYKVAQPTPLPVTGEETLQHWAADLLISGDLADANWAEVTIVD